MDLKVTVPAELSTQGGKVFPFECQTSIIGQRLFLDVQLIASFIVWQHLAESHITVDTFRNKFRKPRPKQAATAIT